MDNHKCVSDLVEQTVITDAYKISNIFRHLNEDSVARGKINKEKVKLRSVHYSYRKFWMLRISIIFFKFIGLATFAHRIVTQRKRRLCTFQYSEIGMVYNSLLISLIIASNFLSIPYTMNMEYENRSNLTVGIEILQNILGSVVICAILLNYCIDQKSLVRIANRLMDIEHEIDCLYRLYSPLRRQRVFFTLFIVCFLKSFLLIALLITEFLAFHSSPVSWLTDILPTFHVGWLMVQYFLLVTVIQADFADVNRAIQSLSGTPDLYSQSVYRTRRVVVSNSTVYQLLKLRDAHSHLCEISENISEFFSMPILFGITFFFLTLIYNGYYLLSPLLMSDEVLEYKIFSNTVFWLIFLIYPVCLLTNRITKISNEIGKTGNVVHDLLSCAVGKKAEAELKQFSLQLLHRNIRFTVNGYFSLDNSFLHSLIGTVATYLVILVQFQMGSKGSFSKPHCNCTREDLSNKE
ncbi:putative gustatory receptor 28b isoform X2 [Pseudomyrmex gracilis]|uniref:putative gustatory receptor 28b isoform X2 n=1 Tax=Pseudomyrmex gracilis TaxID=219809 RepID=UPI0009950081|nr:putative gustatory receptor 28b isoform X2 [Pseudomyrmex gracilis]